MNQEVKVYLPNGHLKESLWGALNKAGYNLRQLTRGYIISQDHPDILFKQVRPQDIPYFVSSGNGDAGITGEDIYNNQYTDDSAGMYSKWIQRYKIRPTKLVAAVSMEIHPRISDIEEFKKEILKKDRFTAATEYTNIAENYFRDWERKPEILVSHGNTESLLLPPKPEADIIIESVETGETLLANRCGIIDVLLPEVHSLFIVNNDSILDPDKSETIKSLANDIRDSLNARSLASLRFNVYDDKNAEEIKDYLSANSYYPTISSLMPEGTAMHLVLEKNEMKFVKLKLRRMGAERITVSDITSFSE